MRGISLQPSGPRTAGLVMSSPYLHGTDPEEQRRLSRLNDLLNQESLRMLDLRGDERILDVGSGLGQLSRAMACAAGPELRLAR